MTVSSSPTAPATAHYEAMRAWVLAGRAPVQCPASLVLVLRQGVAAWLAAGAAVQSAPVSSPAPPARLVHTARGSANAPLVAVLATMIEHVQYTEVAE